MIANHWSVWFCMNILVTRKYLEIRGPNNDNLVDYKQAYISLCNRLYLDFSY